MLSLLLTENTDRAEYEHAVKLLLQAGIAVKTVVVQFTQEALPSQEQAEDVSHAEEAVVEEEPVCEQSASKTPVCATPKAEKPPAYHLPAYTSSPILAEDLRTAAKAAVDAGQLSAATLQLVLPVTFRRANGILTVLEQMGILEAANGRLPRKTLIGQAELQQLLTENSLWEGKLA